MRIFLKAPFNNVYHLSVHIQVLGLNKGIILLNVYQLNIRNS